MGLVKSGNGTRSAGFSLLVKLLPAFLFCEFLCEAIVEACMLERALENPRDKVALANKRLTRVRTRL